MAAGGGAGPGAGGDAGRLTWPCPSPATVATLRFAQRQWAPSVTTLAANGKAWVYSVPPAPERWSTTFRSYREGATCTAIPGTVRLAAVKADLRVDLDSLFTRPFGLR